MKHRAKTGFRPHAPSFGPKGGKSGPSAKGYGKRDKRHFDKPKGRGRDQFSENRSQRRDEFQAEPPRRSWQDKPGRSAYGDKPFHQKRPSRRHEDERPRFDKGKPKFTARPKTPGNGKTRFNSQPRFEKPKQSNPAKNMPTAKGVLMFGLHAVRAAWLNANRRCHRLWLTETAQQSLSEMFTQAEAQGLNRPNVSLVSREQLDEWFPDFVHQGVVLDGDSLGEQTIEDLLAASPSLLVLLDQVTDPHNVGAILRSAAALNAGGVIVTERNSPNQTGTLAKTASGALDMVPLVHVVNIAQTIDKLRAAGYWCVGLAEQGQKNLHDVDMTGKAVLVLGAEGDGLRRLTRERCDELAKLPTSAALPSLNVSNAAAIGLYEVFKQRLGKIA